MLQWCSRRASRRMGVGVVCLIVACEGGTSGPTPEPKPEAKAPGAPNVTGITVGDGSLTVAFTAPGSSGSSAITGYTATCTAASVSKTGTAAASPINVTGLTNGTAYTCTVTASNAAGIGPASNALTGTPTTTSSSAFALSSVGGVSSGSLAETHTCDGAAESPAVGWTGASSNTATFALIMSTQPVSGAAKYNWLLYNISSATTSLAANSKTVGTFGNADDGGGQGYAAPCSPGAGTKEYLFTLYALSGTPSISVPPEQVTGAVLLAAITPLIISSSKITLGVTRTQTQINCTQVRSSLTSYATANTLSVGCDGTYASISTLGIQVAHKMMEGITATNQQVPLAQNFTGTNAWRIPLIPVVATTQTSANDGPIGIAINGVPLFNPCKQGGCDAAAGGGDTKVLGELDSCNGHAGRADDYHYHAAPTCMMADEPSDYWNSHPLGWALDGYGIFGYKNPDGTTATRDAICGGNTIAHQNAPSGYAYHVTDVSPYILSCFYGNPSPDLAGQAQKFSPVRPPGEPMTATNMTLNATAASLAIGGTTTMEWNSGGKKYEVLYKRTSNLCWNFIFKTDGSQTSTSNYCRQF